MNYMEKVAFQNAVNNELKDRYITQLEKRAYYAEMEKEAINAKLMALLALLGGGLGATTAAGGFDKLMGAPGEDLRQLIDPDIGLDVLKGLNTQGGSNTFWNTYGGDQQDLPDSDVLLGTLRGLQEQGTPDSQRSFYENFRTN